MSYKNILIRSDSSSSLGLGHLMRDLVLAQRYTKSNVSFAAQDLQGNKNSLITQNGYSLKILKTNKFKELNKLIQVLEIDLLIIDNYEINNLFEQKIKENHPQLTLMVLDDTYQKHHCDILLNHNIYAKAKKYKGLLPKNCKIECGRKYTLLRDEFLNLKLIKPKKTTTFLAIGGTDHSHINIKILKILESFKSIKVNIVTTSSNENLEKLIKYVEGKKWIQLHIDSKNMAQLMQKSSFGIVSPSVVLNEVSALGLKYIAIKTADNQKEMYKYIKKKNENVLKEYSKTKLSKLIKKLIYA